MEADTGQAKRLKKNDQERVLKELLPSFCIALAYNQIDTFFKRASLIWFWRFPDAEDEVHVHQPFVGDPAYDTHIRCERIKVSQLIDFTICL